MKTLESLVAEKLLKIKAVKLQPANPFTWASRSPASPQKTAKRLQPVRMDRLRHPFHMGYPHRYAKSGPHHPHKHPNS